MKSMKIAMAAILVAALMVIPIALYAVDDTQSEADPTNYQELADILEDINVQNLMKVDLSKKSTAPDETVSGAVIVQDNMYMSKNYKFDNKASITVPTGRSISINPAQSFAISSTGYGSFNFAVGSIIYIVSDGNAPSADNIITQYVMEDDNSFYFTGKFAFTQDVYELTLSADANSSITDSDNTQSRTMEIKFPTANSINVKGTVDSTQTGKVTANISLKATLDVKVPVPESQTKTTDAILKGKAEYTVNVVVPTSSTSSQKDLTVSVKGNCDFGVEFDEYKGKVKNNTDINVKVANYVNKMDNDKNNDKDIKATLNGSLSIDVSTENMDNYKPTGSDTAITVRDANASYKINLDNQNINGEMNVNVGKYELTVFLDTGNEVMTYENLRFNGKYTGELDLDEASPLAVSAPLSLMKSNPSSIVEEYMNGVASKKSADEIKQYASTFFLGKLDKSTGFDQSGITSKYLKAEVGIGKMVYEGYTLEGLNASLEISDSVGLKANVSLSQLTVDGGVAGMAGAGKLNVGSTNFSAVTCTDVENKAMFVVEFSTSAEMRTYSTGSFGDGSLTMSAYAKDVKGKVLIAKKNTVDNLSIGEYSTSMYGISIKGSNMTMDTTKNTFTTAEMKISGNYYGYASVKSVDGTYKNVTLSLVGFNTPVPTVESVTLRIDDLDGDHMDFTRTYDATTNVITNTYNVDGQMYLANVVDDGTLKSLMFAPITDANDNTKETNVFKGGVIVPGGIFVGTEQASFAFPGLTVSGKTVEIDLSLETLTGLAPAEVLVSTSTAVNPYTGSGVMTINNKDIALDLKGTALGVAVDAEGKLTYSLKALPGYKLSKDMTYSGFTLGDCNDKSASITVADSCTSISCAAVPQTYKLSIDGKEIKNDVQYGTTVSGDKLDKDVLYLVDSNGAVVDIVDDGYWSFQYYFAKDMDLKTMKVKTVTTVKTAEINKVESDGAAFTVPAGGSNLQFAMSTKVRFDLSGLSAGNEVTLVAQQTNFNGHDAFIVKAQKGNDVLSSTLYIPVSGEGQRLMHVDEYGRVSERLAETVVIDDQTYLKTVANGYSIFYAEADESPVLNNGGNGGVSPILIVVGVVIAIAVVAGAVVFIKKH